MFSYVFRGKLKASEGIKLASVINGWPHSIGKESSRDMEIEMRLKLCLIQRLKSEKFKP